MGLICITNEHFNQWDAIVRSFHSHDVYYLSGYVKAFQLHGDGEPLLFYYEDDMVRGINVVMKRDIAKDVHFAGKLPEGQYFDFSTPYGYGGWIIEGEQTDGLFDAYESWCRENDVISEFVRFHPVLKNHTDCGKRYEVIPLGETIKMDLSSEETIWGNFTTQNRGKIRKAKRNELVIKHCMNAEILERFRVIYNGTMDKDNATEYYYFKPEFYQSILHDLQDHAEVFYTEKPDGEVIAASIMLLENGRINYHLSGSLREYQNMAPTNLLLYETALWGMKNGYKTLYLGGGVGSGEDNLLIFKRSFNRYEENDRFYIGKKVFLQEQYEHLLKCREDAPHSGFFPQYRG